MLLVNHRALLAIVAVAGVACRQETHSGTDVIDVTAGSPAATRLAALQVNATRVPAVLVADFDQVLSALEIRCTETRDASPGLADIAVKTVEAATKAGREVTHLQVLRTLESSIHEGADMKINCTDAAHKLALEF